MKAKRWLAIFLILTLVIFLCAGALVVYVDPFFHYHAPRTDKYFYTLDNQRSVNDGILRHFDYDALITGSSMTVNFKTSELDELFGTNSVKVPASGASFFETNMLINTALETHPDLKYVFRSVDRNLIIYGSNALRDDLGEYPSYLYDDNIFNDYKYVFNADVLFNRTLNMLAQTREPDFAPGYTSFDEYSNTMKDYEGAFGLADIGGMLSYEPGTVGEPQHLSDSLRETVANNVYQNLVAVTEEHPDTTFYYFLPPYSLGFWNDKLASGEIYAQFEAEQIAIELMLECDNIRLYDFSCRTDIISDVNNYRDLLHYGEWINSFILKWMHDDQYRLTQDNYEEHLARQLEYYSSYDYSQLLTQPRYNCDYYAAALLSEELTGTAPLAVSDEEFMGGELRNAAFETDADTGALVLRCTGTLGRDPAQELGDYLYYTDYAGLKLTIEDAADYSYLCFFGRNTGHNGQPAVFAYDENGMYISSTEMNYNQLAGGWQIFALDLREASGPVTVIFNGAYTDYTGHPASSFEFKELKLY